MADLMPETTKGNKQVTREGLTLAKILYFLSMPFRPNLLKAYMAVDRFVDVPIDQLKADGIKGILMIPMER